MESRRYQTCTVLLFLKGTLSPSVFIGMSHFEESGETLWMMVPGNTNGLFLLLPSTQRQTSFALEDCLLFLKKARAVGGGRWVVGEKGSSYSDFFLDFWGRKTVILYVSFILVFYPLTTLSSLPSEWCFLLQYLFLNNSIEGTQGWHPISLS